MKIDSCIPDYSEQYIYCFGEVGCLKEKHYIVVDMQVLSVIKYPLRRIPVLLEAKLNEELDRLVKTEFITPIEEPADWVSSLVIVEKPNGQLRI